MSFYLLRIRGGVWVSQTQIWKISYVIKPFPNPLKIMLSIHYVQSSNQILQYLKYETEEIDTTCIVTI